MNGVDPATDHDDVLAQFDEAFLGAYPSLHRLASVVCPAEADPDDLIQEALVRALGKRSLDEYESLPAYLRTSIVHLAANERRRLGRQRKALTRASAATGDTTSEYPSDLDDLRRLPPRDRALLYLVVVEQRSFAEVAEYLGCREAAARQRASRALRRLRTELRQDGARHG